MAETVGSLWRGWRDVLTRLGFETAALDAKLLTGHALGLSALAMATGEQAPVSETQARLVADLLQRRMTGESVARIIGSREFYGLDFTLNEATLEPRPETELLVDLALDALPKGGRLLDLGTGTGCIPIAILANTTGTSATAIDLSPRALEAANANAQRHDLTNRVVFLQGSWFDPLAANGGPAGAREHDSDSALLFDLIVSNPPYITSAVVETLAPEVKDFDPRLALDGGPDGLAPYRIIAAQALRHLTPAGVVLVEIGYDQGEAVTALFLAAGFASVHRYQDLNGLDRVVSAHQI